jgi:hypothetical protein
MTMAEQLYEVGRKLAVGRSQCKVQTSRSWARYRAPTRSPINKITSPVATAPCFTNGLAAVEERALPA